MPTCLFTAVDLDVRTKEEHTIPVPAAVEISPGK